MREKHGAEEPTGVPVPIRNAEAQLPRCSHGYERTNVCTNSVSGQQLPRRASEIYAVSAVPILFTSALITC